MKTQQFVLSDFFRLITLILYPIFTATETGYTVGLSPVQLCFIPISEGVTGVHNPENNNYQAFIQAAYSLNAGGIWGI